MVLAEIQDRGRKGLCGRRAVLQGGLWCIVRSLERDRNYTKSRVLECRASSEISRAGETVLSIVSTPTAHSWLVLCCSYTHISLGWGRCTQGPHKFICYFLAINDYLKMVCFSFVMWGLTSPKALKCFSIRIKRKKQKCYFCRIPQKNHTGTWEKPGKELLQDTLPWRVNRSLWNHTAPCSSVSDYGETWLNEDLIWHTLVLAQLPVCLSFSRPSVSYLLPNSIHLSLIFPKVNIFLFRTSLCLFFKFLLPLSLKALTYSIQYSVSACCLLQSSAAPYRLSSFFAVSIACFCHTEEHYQTEQLQSSSSTPYYKSQRTAPLSFKPLFPFLTM